MTSSQTVNNNEFVFDINSCLERVRANDQQAAKELVDFLHSKVIKIVKARKPWRMGDEDLMQEIFLKVFNRLDQYQGDVPFAHWVSRIAVNTCIDQLRYNLRRPEYRMADMTEEKANIIEENVQNQQSFAANDTLARTELVHTLLEKLKEDDKMVLMMMDIEKKTIVEVAKVTGWSCSKVKVRACRARKKLQKLFEELKQEEGEQTLCKQ